MKGCKVVKWTDKEGIPRYKMFRDKHKADFYELYLKIYVEGTTKVRTVHMTEGNYAYNYEYEII